MKILWSKWINKWMFKVVMMRVWVV